MNIIIMKFSNFKTVIVIAKYIFLTLLFFLTILQSLSAIDEINIFDLIKKEVILNKKEYIVAIYQDIGSCTKCYNAPMNYIDKLNKKMQDVEIKYLAFVSCKRKKELKLFIERYRWADAAMVDKGDVKQKLGLPANSQITVFNDKYEIIVNISDENLHIADSLIYEKIKK